MEGLNKTQLILLALLVSFVTSIATGIVTVTLMDQAPAGVTQTINRIVERTVERVVPSNGGATKTVIIKSEDFIIEAVKKNSGSIVKVSTFAQNEKGETIKGEPIGVGFIVSTDGMVALDSDIVSDETSYTVSLADGKIFKANTFQQDEKNGLALIKITPSNDKETIRLSPVELSDLSGENSLKLGQTVIALGGKGDDDVFNGIVSGFRKSSSLTEALLGYQTKAGDVLSGVIDPLLQTGAVINSTENETEIKTINFIKTSISLGKDGSGSPLIDLGGRVVGMNLVREGVSVAIPSPSIKEAMSTPPVVPQKTE